MLSVSLLRTFRIRLTGLCSGWTIYWRKSSRFENPWGDMLSIRYACFDLAQSIGRNKVWDELYCKNKLHPISNYFKWNTANLSQSPPFVVVEIASSLFSASPVENDVVATRTLLKNAICRHALSRETFNPIRTIDRSGFDRSVSLFLSCQFYVMNEVVC